LGSFRKNVAASSISRFAHILIPIVALFEDWVRFAKNIAAGSHRFGFGDFRSRTPGPPPFSSMNPTPAFSRARRTLRSFAVVIE
jgi:hypothetical protein